MEVTKTEEILNVAYSKGMLAGMEKERRRIADAVLEYLNEVLPSGITRCNYMEDGRLVFKEMSDAEIIKGLLAKIL